MLQNNCCFKCSCLTAALIASLIVGIVAAFLQITAVITVTPVFLGAALVAAAAFLLVLVANANRSVALSCKCTTLNALLIGILGTIVFSAILLAAGIVVTSVLSAILVGLQLFFLTLTITAAACYVRCLSDCQS